MNFSLRPTPFRSRLLASAIVSSALFTNHTAALTIDQVQLSGVESDVATEILQQAQLPSGGFVGSVRGELSNETLQALTDSLSGQFGNRQYVAYLRQSNLDKAEKTGVLEINMQPLQLQLEQLSNDASSLRVAEAAPDLNTIDSYPDQLQALQDYVLLANRKAGRNVDLMLTPAQGEQLPTASFTVQDESPNFYLASDNSGTSEDGKLRQNLGYWHPNLTGADDEFRLDYATDSFETSDFVAVSYSRPLMENPRWRWHLGADYSTYTLKDLGITIAGTENLSGTNHNVHAKLEWNVWQSGRHFVDISAGLNYLDTEYDASDLGIPKTRTQFLLPELALNYSQETRRSGLQIDAGVRVRTNLDGIAGTDDNLTPLGRFNASPEFTLINAHASVRQFYPRIFSFLQAKLNSQYVPGDDRLPPSFLDVAGGMYSVRGYEESFTSGDQVTRGSVELHTAIPISPLQLGLFTDFADVRQNDRQPGEQDNQLWSAGISGLLVMGESLSLQFSHGWVLEEANNGSDSARKGDSRTAVSFNWRYRW